MSVNAIASSMKMNLLLTCYENELFFFLLSACSHLPKETGTYAIFLYLKRAREALGFSESVSSLEKEMFLI